VPELKSADEERRRLGLPRECFIVASLGFIGPPKRLPSLLRGVAALPKDIRARTQLLLVGYAPPSEERSLRELAAELGLAAQVRLVGRIKLSDFASYARAADVCVQLRYPTRGETSGALLRELAAGAACIVSDHGSIAELPDDVALKIRTPEHEITDLAAALYRLHHHPEERQTLGTAAVRYIQQRHAPHLVIRQYAAMMELVAARRETEDACWSELACDALARCDNHAEDLIDAWAAVRQEARSPGHRDKYAFPDFRRSIAASLVPAHHGQNV
jgi:glycosyltransferase involved in cell wall biosynthesis